MKFSSLMINLYARDLPRSVAFYEHLGFVEIFRYAPDGVPLHIELTLDGQKIGIAAADAARSDHGLPINLDGHGMELVLWTDDTDAAFAALVDEGSPVLSEPHDWLDDLRLAWVADPDGNPIQIVARRSS